MKTHHTITTTSRPEATYHYSVLSQEYVRVEPDTVGGVSIVSEPEVLGGQNITFGTIRHGRRRNYYIDCVKVHTGPKKGLWILANSSRPTEFTRR